MNQHLTPHHTPASIMGLVGRSDAPGAQAVASVRHAEAHAVRTATEVLDAIVEPTTCQVLMRDGADGLMVEMRSTNIGDLSSPANLMCAFLAKYWGVLTTSMLAEMRQAQAELAGKVVERAPLRLVDSAGVALVQPSSEVPA